MLDLIFLTPTLPLSARPAGLSLKNTSRIQFLLITFIAKPPWLSSHHFLDNCNELLTVVPATTPLQNILSSLREITFKYKSDHMSLLFKIVKWIPILVRIRAKMSHSVLQFLISPMQCALPSCITLTSCYSPRPRPWHLLLLLPWFSRWLPCYSSYTTPTVLTSRPSFTLFFMLRMLFLNPPSFSSVTSNQGSPLGPHYLKEHLVPNPSPPFPMPLSLLFFKALIHWCIHIHTCMHSHVHTISAYACMCTYLLTCLFSYCLSSPLECKLCEYRNFVRCCIPSI